MPHHRLMNTQHLLQNHIVNLQNQIKQSKPDCSLLSLQLYCVVVIYLIHVFLLYQSNNLIL
eukprot:UN04706